jgi:hypothetical protein
MVVMGMDWGDWVSSWVGCGREMNVGWGTEVKGGKMKGYPRPLGSLSWLVERHGLVVCRGCVQQGMIEKNEDKGLDDIKVGGTSMVSGLHDKEIAKERAVKKDEICLCLPVALAEMSARQSATVKRPPCLSPFASCLDCCYQ